MILIDMRKVVKAEAIIDQDLTTQIEKTDEWEDDDDTRTMFEIYAYLNGKQVGYLDFEVHQYSTENQNKNFIDFISVQVNENQQNSGVGTALYKAFSDFYVQNFSGYKITISFHNPVAEYALKKAVFDGQVDSSILSNLVVGREYDDLKQEQWKNLNDKLPNSVRENPVATRKDFRKVIAQPLVKDLRGKVKIAMNLVDLRKFAIKDFRKIIKAELAVAPVAPDLRNIEITDAEETGSLIRDNGITMTDYTIQALQNGMPIGWFQFTTYEYADGKQPTLYVGDVQVSDEYRNLGIGQLMYKKFGEIYNSKFKGWPITRFFANPIAEYSFRKAVGLGWIDSSALKEENMKRDNEEYSQHQPLINDLRNKLPENVKGPETWASVRKDYRKLTASIVDLRKLTRKDFRKKTQIKDLRVKQMLYTAAPKIDESSIEYEITDTTVSDVKGNSVPGKIINIKKGNEYIAYLIFSIHQTEKQLYVEQVEVWDAYQNQGLAQYLFKKLGEIYKQNYNDWVIGMDFQNPAAESAYNKAIEQGWIPTSAFSEGHTKRTYEGRKDFRKVIAFESGDLDHNEEFQEFFKDYFIHFIAPENDINPMELEYGDDTVEEFVYSILPKGAGPVYKEWEKEALEAFNSQKGLAETV